MLADNQIIRSRTTLISLSVYTTFTQQASPNPTRANTPGGGFSTGCTTSRVWNIDIVLGDKPGHKPVCLLCQLTDAEERLSSSNPILYIMAHLQNEEGKTSPTSMSTLLYKV